MDDVKNHRSGQGSGETPTPAHRPDSGSQRTEGPTGGLPERTSPRPPGSPRSPAGPAADSGSAFGADVIDLGAFRRRRAAVGESVGGPRRVAADEGHVGIDETATVEGTDPGAGRSDASVAVRPDVASDRFAPGRTRLVAGRVRPSGCVRGPIPPGASVAAPTDTAREDLEALDAAARVADCALAEITVQLAAMRELLLETFDHPVGRSGGTADP